MPSSPLSENAKSTENGEVMDKGRSLSTVPSLSRKSKRHREKYKEETLLITVLKKNHESLRKKLKSDLHESKVSQSDMDIIETVIEMNADSNEWAQKLICFKGLYLRMKDAGTFTDGGSDADNAEFDIPGILEVQDSDEDSVVSSSSNENGAGVDDTYFN